MSSKALSVERNHYMNAKDKIEALFNESKAWANGNKDILFGLDDDCEEINVECLTISDVMTLLDNLKAKLLDETCQS